jgi:hypothetical protein
MSLSRVSSVATRVAVRSVAARSFCAPAALISQSSQRQSNQQSNKQSNSNGFRYVAGVAAALLSGSVVVAACEQVIEQKKGGDVDYTALRTDLENLLEKEGYDDGSYGPILVRLAWHSAGTYDRHKKKFGTFTTTTAEKKRFFSCARFARAGARCNTRLLSLLYLPGCQCRCIHIFLTPLFDVKTRDSIHGIQMELSSRKSISKRTFFVGRRFLRFLSRVY